jgi:hypothetical protein
VFRLIPIKTSSASRGSLHGPQRTHRLATHLANYMNPMKLNAIRSLPVGYTPPPIPEGLCGPEKLAELLIEARKVQPEYTGPISDDGIRTLVNLIFFASLMPEEGRYPRYKLVCEPAESSIFLVTKIDPLPLDDVNQVRRLAPACAHPNCALLVAERDGLLWCDGVMNVGGMGLRNRTRTPRRHWRRAFAGTAS